MVLKQVYQWNFKLLLQLNLRWWALAINTGEKVAAWGKAEYYDENVTNLLAGAKTKWSFIQQKNWNMNLEQLSGIVCVLHGTSFPQCYLKNGGEREQ